METGDSSLVLIIATEASSATSLDPYQYHGREEGHNEKVTTSNDRNPNWKPQPHALPAEFCLRDDRADVRVNRLQIRSLRLDLQERDQLGSRRECVIGAVLRLGEPFGQDGNQAVVVKDGSVRHGERLAGQVAKFTSQFGAAEFCWFGIVAWWETPAAVRYGE